MLLSTQKTSLLVASQSLYLLNTDMSRSIYDS